jgi:hypothetical protein
VPLTRRSLLVVGALTAAGCSTHRHHSAPQPSVVPDAVALETARDLEQSLIAEYDTKIATAGAQARARLQVERAIHVTHLSALHGTHPAATVPSPAPAARPDITRILRHSVRSLRSLALAATSGANAALLASIAASHQTSAQ